MDILATMTREEYRTARQQLTAQNLWDVAGDRSRERRSNAAAERVVKGIRN